VEDGREAAVARTAELSPLPSLPAAADIGQDDGLAAEEAIRQGCGMSEGGDVKDGFLNDGG
jgi:hypothetical protein